MSPKKTVHDRLYKEVNQDFSRFGTGGGNAPQSIDRQNDFLKSQFQKIVQQRYYDHIAIEADRRGAYIDFEQMEYYPTIASALDVMAEECTLPNSKGNVLNIYSDITRIKEELEYLFYDVLDLNANLFWWARNIIKNGDMFVLLLTQSGDGITTANILNKLVERREEVDEDAGILRTFFKDNQRNETYERQQVAHFRLMGDEKRIPYGQSALEKIRKIHKMIVMAEDAMMIKRLTRSTDRLVYNVQVGNMDGNDVDSYIDALANQFKQEPIVDPRNGNVDYKYNVMDVTQDYFIPQRNSSKATTIDTIPGSTNLDQIGDLEYLREQLHTGLGVPMTFLSYSEAQGEGKSMSSLDHRFARKISRFQQCIVQELNFIAKTHLLLRGYEDDYETFTLTLNPSSIQSEILKAEHLNNLLNNYQTAVTPSDATQIAPMSELRAKMEILGMSKDEIVLDLEQQMMERAIGEEFRQNFTKIDASGIFKELTKRFAKPEGESSASDTDQAAEKETQSAGAGDSGGNTDNPFEDISALRRKKYLNKAQLLQEQVKKLSK